MFDMFVLLIGLLNLMFAYGDYMTNALDGFSLFQSFIGGVLVTQAAYRFLEIE